VVDLRDRIKLSQDRYCGRSAEPLSSRVVSTEAAKLKLLGLSTRAAHTLVFCGYTADDLPTVLNDLSSLESRYLLRLPSVGKKTAKELQDWVGFQTREAEPDDRGFCDVPLLSAEQLAAE
jgi:hypothetical protein